MSKGSVNPGCRSKHALLGGSDKIYLVGGLKASNEASGDIFEYCP